MTFGQTRVDGLRLMRACRYLVQRPFGANADVVRAANGIVWSALANAGQNCAAVERVYVEKSIADAVQYVQTLRDNGQLVEIPQKGAAGDIANKSPSVQGATHEIRRDEKGRRVFQRTRFSVT